MNHVIPALGGNGMAIPLQITAHNFELTDAIEREIRKNAEKLEKFYDRINRCRVVVEVPHRHKRDGKLYNVRIDIRLPGKNLVIKREQHEDLYVAVRDAFSAAIRQIEDKARRERGDVKQHEEMEHARVSAIFFDEGYGFLRTPGGREIYFHENSVLNSGFKRLSVGIEVRYTEEMGEEGPQASTVVSL